MRLFLKEKVFEFRNKLNRIAKKWGSY